MKQERKTTLEVIHDYGELITTYYLIVMLAFVPFFYQNGYSDIANAKYKIYRLVTTAFIIICGFICYLVETGCLRGENVKRRPKLPIIFVLTHLLSHIISWIFSSNHKTSWVGNGSWHMGFRVQLLFIGAMLLVFYYYKDKLSIWIAAGIGAGITGLLTVLNRFDIYPNKMGNTYPGFISTLGQTNWATMYVACLMGAGIAYYIYEENRMRRMIALVVDAFIFMGAWVIGSDTILPVMMAELFILFGVCISKREMLKRFSVIIAMFGVVTEIVYVLVFVLFHDKFVFVDENDAVNSLLRKHVGVLIILVALVFMAALYATREKEWKGKALKILYKVMVSGLLVGIILIVIAMVVVTNTPEKAGNLANIRMLNFDYDWGTHRGLNWRCAVYGFERLPFLRKIIGTGQGGFEAYIYSFQDFEESLIDMYGKFKLMVAHNEYLNFLVENGILGCITYAGFIVSSFVTLWKRADKSRLSMMALLSLSGYFACSIFFFQHVYATSFMYLFVAMALSEERKTKIAN